MTISRSNSRLRIAALLVFAAVCLTCAAVAVTPFADSAVAAKKKKKKCKKGYQRVGKKCKRKPLLIKPSKIELVVGVAKGATYTNFTDTQRKVGLTGEQMTAVLVIQGVRSNTQVLIK